MMKFSCHFREVDNGGPKFYIRFKTSVSPLMLLTHEKQKIEEVERGTSRIPAIAMLTGKFMGTGSDSRAGQGASTPQC